MREALWVRKLFTDFLLLVVALDLRSDGTGDIGLDKEFNNTAATKHTDVAYNMQRDYCAKGLVSVTHVPTTVMVENGMTKPLGPEKLSLNVRCTECLKSLTIRVKTAKAC